MKNKFLKYLSTYNEVFQPKDYRDTQIAKLTNGIQDIEKYEIKNITFYGDFFSHIKNFLDNFPALDEIKIDVSKSPEDLFKTKESRLKETNNARAEDDEDEFDDEDYNGDEVYNYDDEEDDDDVLEEVFKDSTAKNIYNPFTTKAKEHEYQSIDEKSLNYIHNLSQQIEYIKNGDYNFDVVNNINNKNFKKLLKEKNYNQDFYKYIYCGFLNAFKKNNYLERLISVRGNNFLWLKSSIKDTIFTPISRNFISDFAEKKKDLLLIKKLIPDYANKKSMEIIKDLEKISKNKDTNIKKIVANIKTNKDYYTQEELTLIESKKAVLQLFNKIKIRFMNNAKINKNFKSIGLRKFIFDYETGKPSVLTNEVINDIKTLKIILMKMEYTFNEIELELGRVNKNDKLYSFKDLIPILKQEMTELKTFSSEKELERNRLLNELGITNIPKASSVVEEKIKQNDELQINDFKEMLGYDNKINKKLSDLIREAKNIDDKKTNEILKKYNKNKLNKLLVLCKEKETFEETNNKIDKNEYEEAIRILSNPMTITDKSKMKIIFTLSPRAFISQSTRVNVANNIRSCMNIFDGINKKFIPTSLMAGAFAVFLVKVNKDKDGNDIIDSKIIDPVARILIKPLRDKDGNIFWYPDKEYVSDNRYKNLSEKVFDIIGFQSESLPEETFNIDDKAHYRDHIGQFENDVYFKTINDQEKIKKYLNDKNASKEEKFIFLDKILNKYPSSVIINKINDVGVKNKINTMNLHIDRDIEDDTLSIFKEIDYLSLGENNIKKIDDNVKINDIYIDSESKLRDLNNLKYIKEIRQLIINNNAKYPENINGSKKLTRLTLGREADVKNVKEIISPNAEIDLNLLKNSLEKISGKDVSITSLNLKNIKSIEAIKLSLNNLIEKESETEYKKFFKNIDKVLNDKKLTFYVFLINSQEETDEALQQLENNTFDFKDEDARNFCKLFLKQKDIPMLNPEEINFLKNYFYYVKQLYHVYSDIKVKSDDKEFNKLLTKLFDNFNSLDDKEMNELLEAYKKKDIIIDYFNKFTFDVINLKSIKKVKSLTFNYCVFGNILDLRHLKDLEELDIANSAFDKNMKVYLPESIEKLDIDSFTMKIHFSLNFIQNLKDLKKLESVKTDEEYSKIDIEVLQKIKKITNRKDMDFDLKMLNNPYYYNLFTSNMSNKESINNIEYNFNGFKKNIKQIPKYIAQNKIDEKLKEQNLLKNIINEKTIFNKTSVNKLLPTLNNTIFCNIEVEKNVDKILNDKTVFLTTTYIDSDTVEKQIIVTLKNFYDFYLDIETHQEDNNWIKLIIEDTTGNIDLTKVLQKIKNNNNKINVDIIIKTNKKDAKIISDYEYQINEKYASYNQNMDKEIIFNSIMNYYLDLDIENIKKEFEIKCRSIDDMTNSLIVHTRIDKIINEIEKYFKNVKKITDAVKTSIEIKVKELVNPIKAKVSDRYELKIFLRANDDNLMEFMSDIEKDEKKYFIVMTIVKQLLQNTSLKNIDRYSDLYDNDLLKNLKAL
jgi:hypothetical protein